jgi:hypothetical protein
MIHPVASAAALTLALLVSSAGSVAQQGSVVHGADSMFSAPTVKLVWAIYRGVTESTTEVIIRAVDTADSYRFIRVDAVDPFSKQHKNLVATRPFDRQTDLIVPRSAFAETPSAEIHLFHTAEDLAGERPALTVFYLSVPDTTPEFTALTQADAYLKRMSAQPR